MDKGVQAQYKAFLNSPAGADLRDRLKMMEAAYMSTGMKSDSLETKGLSFARMEGVYRVRTMLDDLANTEDKDLKVQLSKDA